MSKWGTGIVPNFSTPTFLVHTDDFRKIKKYKLAIDNKEPPELSYIFDLK